MSEYIIKLYIGVLKEKHSPKDEYWYHGLLAAIEYEAGYEQAICELNSDV